MKSVLLLLGETELVQIKLDEIEGKSVLPLLGETYSLGIRATRIFLSEVYFL